MRKPPTTRAKPRVRGIRGRHNWETDRRSGTSGLPPQIPYLLTYIYILPRRQPQFSIAHAHSALTVGGAEPCPLSFLVIPLSQAQPPRIHTLSARRGRDQASTRHALWGVFATTNPTTHTQRLHPPRRHPPAAARAFSFLLHFESFVSLWKKKKKKRRENSSSSSEPKKILLSLLLFFFFFEPVSVPRLAGFSLIT